MVANRIQGTNLNIDERTRVVLARTVIDKILDEEETKSEGRLQVSIQIKTIVRKAELCEPLTPKEISALMQIYRSEGFEVSATHDSLVFTSKWGRKTTIRRK